MKMTEKILKKIGRALWAGIVGLVVGAFMGVIAGGFIGALFFGIPMGIMMFLAFLFD